MRIFSPHPNMFSRFLFCFVWLCSLNLLAFLHTRVECFFIHSFIPLTSTSVFREPIKTGSSPSTVNWQWIMAINCPHFLHILKEVNFPRNSFVAAYKFQHIVVSLSFFLNYNLPYFLSPSEARGQDEWKIQFLIFLQKELPDIQ